MPSALPNLNKREELSAQELYKRSLRVRLTRAGLVKIMEANEAMERKKEDDRAEGQDSGSSSDSAD